MIKKIISFTILASVILSCTQSTQGLYEEASLRFDKEDYEGAVRLLDSVISMDDTNSEAYHIRGSSKFNLGDFVGAIVDYSRTIELTSRKVDPELYYYRGDAYLNLRQLDNAINDFSMAVTAKPDYAEAYNLRADAWTASGTLDSAYTDYARSIKINPNIAEPYFGLANYFKNISDYDQAIAFYSKAIELSPQADYYFNRGLVYYVEKDFANAISDFTKTIEADSKFIEAYVMRGNMKDEGGLGKEALTDFDEAIRIDPTYGSAYFNRGITRKSQGDLIGACQDFNKALELGYQEAIAKTGDCPN